jgi:hypothetical protein
MNENDLRDHQNKQLQRLKLSPETFNKIQTKNKTEKIIAKIRKKREELLSNKFTQDDDDNMFSNVLGTPPKPSKSMKQSSFMNDCNP